ncbi:hypothetical protein F2Q69_00041709 [Brassica cretica]|uniref:Dymeclin n=1 Tax=Brassica cretica TaxID=69181 RepID=A0A8S9NFG1_BRACR|nr:hypothetical protein F2Q69_00041709 [Brassica cretica]
MGGVPSTLQNTGGGDDVFRGGVSHYDKLLELPSSSRWPSDRVHQACELFAQNNGYTRHLAKLLIHLSWCLQELLHAYDDDQASIYKKVVNEIYIASVFLKHLIENGKSDSLEELHLSLDEKCIDRWLESNKTCPVCRRNLDPTAPENIKELIIEVIHENSNGNQDQTSTSKEVLLSRQSTEVKMESLPDKFSRSKTTGHSIVRNKPEEEDRFTLRLPDHVKIKVTRRHNNNQTESCISFGELMRNREGRFGELSGQSLVPESEN